MSSIAKAGGGSSSPATPSVAGTVTSFVPTIKSGIKTMSADYTILDTDGYDVFLVTLGAVTPVALYLPTAADNARREILVYVAAASGASLLIDGEGAETINGESSIILNTANQYLRLLCTGSAWLVVG